MEGIRECPSCGYGNHKEFRFCGICGTELVETKKEALNDYNRWVRDQTDFARRFEVRDVKGILSKRIVVEQGTKALMIQGGVYKEFLPAGVYNAGSLLSRIRAFHPEKRTTVILTDAGEVNLTFMIPKNALLTKDGVPVCATGKYTVQIKDPVAFLENYLKGREQVRLANLENELADEILSATRTLLTRYNADELYGNRQLHTELSNELKEELNVHAGSRGLEILRLNYIGFDDDARQEILNIRQELELSYQKMQDSIKYQKNARTLETENEADIIRQEATLRDAKTEAMSGDIKARHITAGLDEDLHRERDAKKTDFELAQDGKIFDHNLDRQKKKDDAYKARLEGLLEIKKKKETDRLDIRERELEIRRENEKKLLENRSDVPMEVLLSVMGSDNPHVKEIAEMEMMKRANSLSAEQLLALNAKGDPAAAAEALGKMINAEKTEKLNEQRIRDHQAFNTMIQAQFRENAAQMKSVMNAALASMGQTATARATAQNPGATVIAGGKRTVVVDTNRPMTSANIPEDDEISDRETENTHCPYCSENVPDENLYCPACGKRVR